MLVSKRFIQAFLSISTALLVAVPATVYGQAIECEYNDVLWSIDVGNQAALNANGFGVGIDNDWLFATHQGMLSIVDIGDPADPVPLTVSQSVLPFFLRTIQVRNRFAYVSTSSPSNGFVILDCSDPTNLVVLAQYTLGTAVRDLLVTGSLLVVTDINHELRVFDISNPQAGAAFQGSIQLDSSFFARQYLSAKGPTVFVTNSDGFDCVDISDPKNPYVAGQYASDAPPTALASNESHIFLVYNGKIEAVDITLPTAPALLSVLLDDIAPTHAMVHGNLLSVSDFYGGIFTYDISDPHKLRRLGSRRPTTETVRVTATGNVCFAVSNRRITALNVSDQRPSSRLAKLPPVDPLLSGAISLKSSQDLLFVQNNGGSSFSSFDRVGVVDLSNPLSPVSLGLYEMSLHARSMAVNGSVVFLSTPTKGIFSVDLADPTSPVTLGQYDTADNLENSLREMLFDNNLIYAHSFDMFAILDVNNLVEMSLLSSLYVGPNHIVGMAKEGHLVYLIDSRWRMIIVNVLNPASPTILWINEFPTNAFNSNQTSVSVSDGLLVFANDTTPYQFVDVSIPFLPVWYPPLMPQTHAARCVIQDGRAYLYDEVLGLEIYSVTSMPNLELVGISGARSASHGLAILRDNVCVVGGGIGGFDVIRIGSDCSTPCLADTNHDGTLSPADFTAWIAAFNAQAPECDQNDDGSCTPADFTAWIANYNAGC